MKEIFNGEELTEDGKMPKASFQHFYMETWLKAQGTAWKDLKKLKYSDDLKFRGEPTRKEYGDLDLRSALPENCFRAFTCAAFQQKIFLESKGCRMNVTMLHESMNANNHPKSSLQLLKVLLTTLTTRRSIEDYNAIIDSAVVLLKNILEKNDENKVKRLQLTFLHKDLGLLNFVQNLVRNAEKDNYNYSSNNNSKQNNRKIPWSVICTIYEMSVSIPVVSINLLLLISNDLMQVLLLTPIGPSAVATVFILY